MVHISRGLTVQAPLILRTTVVPTGKSYVHHIILDIRTLVLCTNCSGTEVISFTILLLEK